MRLWRAPRVRSAFKPSTMPLAANPGIRRTAGSWRYTHKMARGANIRLNCALEQVTFGSRQLRFSDGSEVSYRRLVSTIPLKSLIQLSTDAPSAVRDAAEKLTCTNFLRVDVAVNHPARRPETWMYVYDEDKLSVRLSHMEHFSPNNAPPGCSAIQVEVYGSEYRPVPTDLEKVKSTVIAELVEMGLVDSADAVRYVNVKFVPQGNPIFDHNRAAAMRDDHRVPRSPRSAAGRPLRRAQISDDRRVHHQRQARGRNGHGAGRASDR